jgi:NitT/TauT family transport system substrate-binding protein
MALVLAVLFSPATLPVQADPLQKVRLLLDWYPQAETGGYICALVKGYYRAAGLDVEILPANPGMQAPSLLLAGRAEFAMAPQTDTMVQRQQGLPFVCIMTTMQHDPKAVMVHDDSPVKDFPDLDGRAIAVQPGTYWLQYVIRKYHLKDVQERRLTLGVASFIEDPNYIQENFVTSEPFACQQQGVKVRSLLVSSSGYDPYRVVITTDKFIHDNPAAVSGFVSASIKGWQTYLADPAATDEEIKRRNPQMTQAQLDFSRQTLIDGHFVTGFPDKGEAVGRLDPARFDAIDKILIQLGLLQPDFDYHPSFTTQFCGAAAK